MNFFFLLNKIGASRKCMVEISKKLRRKNMSFSKKTVDVKDPVFKNLFATFHSYFNIWSLISFIFYMLVSKHQTTPVDYGQAWSVWNICFGFYRNNVKQGRIHGSPVAGGWAGAVMAIRSLETMVDQPTDRPTDRPTDTVAYRSRCPRQKAPSL